MYVCSAVWDALPRAAVRDLTAVAAFGIGNMVQANSISTMLAEPMEVPPWLAHLGVTSKTVHVPNLGERGR